MKTLIIVFLGLIIWSCGGDDDSLEPLPQVNVAPSIPLQTYPINGSLCTENPVNITWERSIDADGDNISYEVQVSTNDDFSSDLQSKTSATLTANFTLIKGVAYYWRIRSKDTKNNFSDYANNWKFYSEGEGVSNHIPFAPELISPEINSVLTEVSSKLEWMASDLDNDPLVYDVYFGSSNPPELVLSDSDITSHDVILDGSSIYYWKIVVKDDQGAQTIGQIWSFESQ